MADKSFAAYQNDIGGTVENADGVFALVPGEIQAVAGLKIGAGFLLGAAVKDEAETLSVKEVTEEAAKKNGETLATVAGRKAHKAWDPGPGFEKEVTLPNGKRADAVNMVTRTVKELKPDSPRATKRGESQVQSYVKSLEEAFGGSRTGIVETYR